MKLLDHIANPVFILLIIGTFAYTYIFYFRDADPVKKREAEMEREIRQRTAQAADPNIAVAAGTAFQETDRFIGQQNRQNPLV
ncbi:MAG: hypothetical protein M1406_03845, partial [Nitrospirae bacterium]|nr:hypothetical protein [Nitrospirota bacterium]